MVVRPPRRVFPCEARHSVNEWKENYTIWKEHEDFSCVPSFSLYLFHFILRVKLKYYKQKIQNGVKICIIKTEKCIYSKKNRAQSDTVRLNAIELRAS